MFVKILFQT